MLIVKNDCQVIKINKYIPNIFWEKNFNILMTILYNSFVASFTIQKFALYELSTILNKFKNVIFQFTVVYFNCFSKVNDTIC